MHSNTRLLKLTQTLVPGYSSRMFQAVNCEVLPGPSTNLNSGSSQSETNWFSLSCKIYQVTRFTMSHRTVLSNIRNEVTPQRLGINWLNQPLAQIDGISALFGKGIFPGNPGTACHQLVNSNSLPKSKEDSSSTA